MLNDYCGSQNKASPMTRRLSQLCLFTALFALCVILLGAYTRLKDAGLGCPDWPGCYGQILAPATPEAITQANNAFPSAPVDTQKAQTEMTHRYFAETLGSLIVIFAALCWYKRRTLPLPVYLGPLLVLLVLFQGLLGMWTVTLKLLPVVVMGHLLGGFTLVCLLTLCWIYLRGYHTTLIAQGTSPTLFPLSMVTLGALITQIALGGWTSANYAALICPDFPTCQGYWWPPSHTLTMIHMAHRVGALITFVLGITLTIALWQQRIRLLRYFSAALLGLLVLQVFLGISNVIFSLPLPVALAHHGTAALLLLLLITLNVVLLHTPRKKGATI